MLQRQEQWLPSYWVRASTPGAVLSGLFLSVGKRASLLQILQGRWHSGIRVGKEIQPKSGNAIYFHPSVAFFIQGMMPIPG